MAIPLCHLRSKPVSDGCDSSCPKRDGQPSSDGPPSAQDHPAGAVSSRHAVLRRLGERCRRGLGEDSNCTMGTERAERPRTLRDRINCSSARSRSAWLIPEPEPARTTNGWSSDGDAQDATRGRRKHTRVAAKLTPPVPQPQHRQDATKTYHAAPASVPSAEPPSRAPSTHSSSFTPTS